MVDMVPPAYVNADCLANDTRPLSRLASSNQIFDGVGVGKKLFGISRCAIRLLLSFELGEVGGHVGGL